MATKKNKKQTVRNFETAGVMITKPELKKQQAESKRIMLENIKRQEISEKKYEAKKDAELRLECFRLSQMDVSYSTIENNRSGDRNYKTEMIKASIDGAKKIFNYIKTGK